MSGYTDLQVLPIIQTKEEGSTRIKEATSERDIIIDQVVEMNKTIDSLNKEIKRLQDKEVMDRLNYLKEAGASW